MNKINNFKIESDKCKFTWEYNGEKHQIKFLISINSVIKLNDESGFAVVGSSEEFGKKNAMIINSDASIRKQLEIHKTLKNPICFYEIYYVNKELTGVIICKSCDYSCKIDEKDGKYIGIYETR